MATWNKKNVNLTVFLDKDVDKKFQQGVVGASDETGECSRSSIPQSTKIPKEENDRKLEPFVALSRIRLESPVKVGGGGKKKHSVDLRIMDEPEQRFGHRSLPPRKVKREMSVRPYSPCGRKSIFRVETATKKRVEDRSSVPKLENNKRSTAPKTRVDQRRGNVSAKIKSPTPTPSFLAPKPSAPKSSAKPSKSRGIPSLRPVSSDSVSISSSISGKDIPAPRSSVCSCAPSYWRRIMNPPVAVCGFSRCRAPLEEKERFHHLKRISHGSCLVSRGCYCMEERQERAVDNWVRKTVELRREDLGADLDIDENFDADLDENFDVDLDENFDEHDHHHHRWVCDNIIEENEEGYDVEGEELGKGSEDDDDDFHSCHSNLDGAVE